MDERICEERHQNTNRRFEDVEERVSKLEGKVIDIDKTLGERINTLEITMKLSTESTNNKIDKMDRKVDKILESKENKKQDANEPKGSDDKMDKFIDVMLETFQNNNKTQNEIKFYKTKQFWIVLGSIVTAVCGIAVAVFK
jgi:tetrahydromethanopterin S-methyltransferase subunit B